MTRAWPWLIGALLLLSAAPGSAAPGFPRRGALPSAAVQALLGKAKAALQARDLSTAQRILEQAYRIAAAPEVLFLLGRIAEADGRILEAHDLMRRFLTDPARLPDQPAVTEAQRVVKLPRPASGQIVILGEPGSLISIDDRLLGAVPLTQPLLLSPGPHRISLQLGARRLDSSVGIQSGRSFEVRFTNHLGTVLTTMLPAVLWVTEQVGVPEGAQNPLADATEQAARATNHALLNSEAALVQAPELKTCMASVACWQSLARKNEVEYVLSMRALYVPPESGSQPSPPPLPPSTEPAAASSLPALGSWQLTLALWRADIATPAAAGTAECAHCTAEQAAVALKPAAAKLLAEGLRRGHGSLTVTSEPSAAQLFVDSAAIGTTPYQQALWTGTHALELRQENFTPAQRNIEVSEGQPVAVAVTLLPVPPPELPPVAQPLPTPSSPPPYAPLRRPLWRLATGGALLGASVILLGIGGRAVNLVGQCVTYSSFGICTDAYDTAAPAAGLLVTGSLLTAAAVVLLALPPSKPKHTPISLRSP